MGNGLGVLGRRIALRDQVDVRFDSLVVIEKGHLCRRMEKKRKKRKDDKKKGLVSCSANSFEAVEKLGVP